MSRRGPVLVKPAKALAETRWFGYLFGVATVLLATGLLATGLRSRVANASALYTIPVLVTASRYGRAPALFASALAFVVFDWLFGEEPGLGPAHWPTLLVFLLTALITGQLAAMLREQAETARQRKREVVGLQQLAGTLLQEHDVDRLFHSICQQLHSLTDAAAVALALFDEREQAFEVRAGVGPGAFARRGLRIPAAGSFAGAAVRTNQAQRSEDPQRDSPGCTGSPVAAETDSHPERADAHAPASGGRHLDVQQARGAGLHRARRRARDAVCTAGGGGDRECAAVRRDAW